jgi:dephospho-CoA kinase
MGTTLGQDALVVGLTGGIAAGKSTVASMFHELGAPVLDADNLAREVTARGSETLRRIAKELGEQILDRAGELDRKALGRLVFSDPGARARLEAIVHPVIAGAARERIEELARDGHSVVIYEAALLVETNRHREMDRLVVVTAGDAARIARLMARDGLDRAQAEARLAAQLPQRQKAELADYVIDNSGPLAQTRARAESVWRALCADADRRSGNP